MSGLAVFIILGDLIVSAAVVGLAIWLFSHDNDAMQEAARLPLDDDDAN